MIERGEKAGEEAVGFKIAAGLYPPPGGGVDMPLV